MRWRIPKSTDIQRAEYKLRQADVLLIYLQGLPQQMASRKRSTGYDESACKLELETFFLACLGTARAAYAILKTSRRFQQIRAQFVASKSADSIRFEALVTMRNRDAHSGTAKTDAIDTMISAEDQTSPYQQQHHYSGWPASTEMEYTAPDGTKFTARALQGSLGLFVTVDGVRYEASKACSFFINQLRALIAQAKAA